jgi:hypothetical protein
VDRKALLLVVLIVAFAAVIVWAKSASILKINPPKGLLLGNTTNSMPNGLSGGQIFFSGVGTATNPYYKFNSKRIAITAGTALLPSNASGNSITSLGPQVTCKNITAGKQACFTSVKAGQLTFGDTQYALENVTVGTNNIGAYVYSNGTEVGIISLTGFGKTGGGTWTGQLVLNDVKYSVNIPMADHHASWGTVSQETIQAVPGNVGNCTVQRPNISMTEILQCEQNGGRIYFGTDANGCPTAPKCVTTACAAITRMSEQNMTACISSRGKIVAGVDSNGCPLSPTCVLPSVVG